jgi:hypothetical protein
VCATKRNGVMGGKPLRLYRQALSPWGVALHDAMQGEIAAPERYRCGARQAAKKPGLAQDAYGEQTKEQKTYGKSCPCLKILPDGTATASNGITCSKGCPRLVLRNYQSKGYQR